MKKIHITTLGCSKNTVDSEVLAGQLEQNQFDIVDQPEDADVLILNTCGFIQDAKEESIQAIFEALKLKEDDPAKKVYVAGCLSERYKEEISKEIPEVDAFFGTEDYQSILNILGQKHAAMDNVYLQRRISTPRHYAYLKISEGCNHQCSFCAIPQIRGKHRSRTIESLLDETRKLVDHGAREIILISQDTSYYGRDLYGKSGIFDLVNKMQKIDKLDWIRILYWYPANFPIEILDLMKEGGKVLPYLDMPIQHISDNVLRQMKRGDTRSSLLNLLKKIRTKVPDIALRTTLILGHPGEEEKDFDELLQFIMDIKFDRLGTFIYSEEEGTASYGLGSKVLPDTAAKRQRVLMEKQMEISLQANKSCIGKTMKIIIDEYEQQNQTYYGRSYRDAPEIDNDVIITEPSDNHGRRTGRIEKVKIIDASEYELYGEFKSDKT